MFIATNRIPVPTEQHEMMKQAFRKNAASLKEIPGFLHFELWTTENAILSVSKWENKDAFDNYTQSEAFRQHHAGHSHATGKPELTFYQGEALM